MVDNHEDHAPVCTQMQPCLHVQHLHREFTRATEQQSAMLRDLTARIDRQLDREEEERGRIDARLDALERTITRWGAWLAAAGFVGMLGWNALEMIMKVVAKGG